MQIKAIILEGVSDSKKPSILVIEPQGSRLVPAKSYKDMGVYAFAAAMQKEYPGASVACIGPAGERLYNSAAVAVTDPDGCPSRYCGRGGLGAVMGAKGLKGVVIPEKGKVPVSQEQPFKEALKRYTKTLKEAPSTQAYHDFGTAAMGADHTAGPTARVEVDYASPADQADLSLKMQKLIAMFDCTGLCMFTIGAMAPNPGLVLDLINARFGWNKDLNWLNSMYLEMMRLEHDFNLRAG